MRDSDALDNPMTGCLHENRRCLNHFDSFRKYHCIDCGRTAVCECERDVVSILFPHQSRTGREAGTAEEYEVNGFAKICAVCRGEREEPHPVAQIYGRKKKLDRYYWREIKLTYLKRILAYLDEKKETVKDIFDFEKRFPGIKDQFKKEAREYWQRQHETAPLYVYSDRSEDVFLKEVLAEVITVSAPFINRDGKGLWRADDEREVSAESFVADLYRSKGYEVHRCERRIVSTLIAAYLWTPLNAPDEKLQICGFGSRGKFSKTPAADFDKHGILWFHKPRDFGSKEFFSRKKAEFAEWLDLLRGSDTLLDQFDYFLGTSQHLRDYLWVHNDEAEAATRAFLSVVPDAITYQVIEWAIGNFWNRQPGWPDLFAVKGSEHLFIEVKGPNDKLSPDQMNWFEKMVGDKLLNCCIVRLKKAAAEDGDAAKKSRS